MEDNKKPSGTISSEDSYCGSFSLKNPWNLFNDAENSYSAQAYPDVRQVYNALQNVFQGMGSQPGVNLTLLGGIFFSLEITMFFGQKLQNQRQILSDDLFCFRTKSF